MLNWRLLAERRILAAMEQGEFDDLPGKGQPLQLPEDALVPPEWRLAYNLLHEAGLAPVWIMHDAEVRSDMDTLARMRRREQLWMEERRTAIAHMSAEERAAECARLRQVQAQTWEQVREFITKLNRRIADFNLIVPIFWMQRRPLDLAEEEAAFRKAWGTCQEEEML